MPGSMNNDIRGNRRVQLGSARAQSRPALLPMDGGRTESPLSGLRQPQQFQSPQWPDRPQYQQPEGTYDLNRAMTAAIESELLPEEFNSILGQMGVVNQEQRDQAIGAYSRELEKYGDEMKRVDFERGERATLEKGAQETLASEKQYGLDLAKTARETLGEERRYGLDLGKHKLEVSKHDLATRKALTPKEEKWAGSRKAAEYERGTKISMAETKEKEAAQKEKRTSESKIKAADLKHKRSLQNEILKQKTKIAEMEGLVEGDDPEYTQAIRNLRTLQDRAGTFKKKKSSVMKEMPTAAQYKDKIIKDTETGKRYKSDGKNWNEI